MVRWPATMCRCPLSISEDSATRKLRIAPRSWINPTAHPQTFKCLLEMLEAANVAALLVLVTYGETCLSGWAFLAWI